MTNTSGERDSAHHTNESTINTTTRRYWRRSNRQRPWWPGGIIPVAGLLVTFFVGAVFMAPRIEAEVRTEVQQRLEQQSFDASTRSDGQGITIRAPAFETDADHIDAIARSTRCQTWAGQLTCPTTVRLALVDPTAEPADAIVTAPPIVAAEPEVPINAAGAVVTMSESPTIADLCNTSFAAILSNASIQFETGSADIDADSGNVLSRLARVANGCPGLIRIEGHTDSQGDAGMNLVLSNARASAVRTALAELSVDAERLVAEGFGESRPSVSNDTAEGRAENRRIVISVKE